MKTIVRVMCVTIMVHLFGCSSEMAKRTAYESLQYKAQMDCQQHPGSACPDKKSYDDYQRSLRERNGTVK